MASGQSWFDMKRFIFHLFMLLLIIGIYFFAIYSENREFNDRSKDKDINNNNNGKFKN